MSTPHLYFAFLSGHEHLADHPDPGGSIPAGLPQAGLGEAEINHQIAAQAAALTPGALLLPHDLGASARLSYAAQMAAAERLIATRAVAEGHTDWRLFVLHVHGDMGAHRNRLLFYDARSAWGKAAIQTMAVEPTNMEPYVQAVRVFETRPDPEPKVPNPDDWLARAYNCIEGAWGLHHTFAGLVEVGNLRSLQHAPMWTPDGIARAAGWIARAAQRVGG